jgi:hypothetical protein
MDARATLEPPTTVTSSREAGLHQRRLLPTVSHIGNASAMGSRSVSSGDGVANLNDSGREDVGSEAASVDHRAKQGGSGEALKM